MKEFTREDIKLLAAVERDMDAGRQEFVVLNGNRCAMTPEAMQEFGLASGQTITHEIFTAILRFNIAECSAKIKLRDAPPN